MRSAVVVRAEQSDDAPANNGRPPVRGKTRPQPKVTVSAPVVERAMSEAPPTPAAQNETAALLALTAVFLAIIVEGLLVASSGFMSEEWDGIVQVRPWRGAARGCAHRRARADAAPQNNVLPIFAPTLGLFLLGSSAYGAARAARAVAPALPGADAAPQACLRRTARRSDARAV